METRMRVCVSKLAKATQLLSERTKIKTPAVRLYNLFITQWLYHPSLANIL